jgi:hypothetical protein
MGDLAVGLGFDGRKFFEDCGKNILDSVLKHFVV